MELSESKHPMIPRIIKEFLLVFRDAAMLRIIFVVPLIQLLVLAYAVSMDLKNVRIVILDQDHSAVSRRLTDAYFASDLFVPGPAVSTPNQMNRALIENRADICLWIPRGLERDIAAGSGAEVGMYVDGTNSQLAGQAAGAAQAVLLQEANRMMTNIALRQPVLVQGLHRVEAVSRFFYNPELKSRYYMVPAIVVLLVTIISAMLTGMAVVREKEIGTLEQMMVTPISSWQFIAGKTIPFAMLAFVELTIATVFAKLWFKLPLAGSVWLLAGGMLAYLLVTLGVGLLASTVSRTQQQAMFTIWFFLTFGILMSGFFYPVENMPMWAQYLTYVNPMRYIVFVVRGIFLKGATLKDLTPQLIPLGTLGLLIFSAAVYRFRRQRTRPDG